MSASGRYPFVERLLAADAKGNSRTLMNLAALCLEEAARRNDKVVTAEIVNTVSNECQQ